MWRSIIAPEAHDFYDSSVTRSRERDRKHKWLIRLSEWASPIASAKHTGFYIFSEVRNEP